jgi:hypothetical protein
MWKNVSSASVALVLCVGSLAHAGGHGGGGHGGGGHAISSFSSRLPTTGHVNPTGWHPGSNRTMASPTKYSGPNHYHWSHYCWNRSYGCYCYWCPWSSCYYYWYAPGNCYYPISSINQYPPATNVAQSNTQVVNVQNGATPPALPGSGPVMPYTAP